jgi:hypothetical protein
MLNQERNESLRGDRHSCRIIPSHEIRADDAPEYLIGDEAGQHEQKNRGYGDEVAEIAEQQRSHASG